MTMRVYDAMGNGTGDVSPNLTGGHQDRVTDYTAIVMEDDGNENDGIQDEGRSGIFSDVRRCLPDAGHTGGGEIMGTAEMDGDNVKQGENTMKPRLRARRLLPVECERLMGFPDGWTRIPWKGRPAEECPDSPRYKASGNSMGVNCMRWLGLGIQAVEDRKEAKR